MPEAIDVSELPEWLSFVVTTLETPRLDESLQKGTQELAGEIGKGFLSSQDPSGSPWPPLARKRPIGHNQGTRPLIDFGDLLLSVISGGPGNIEQVTGDSVTYGTSVWYAHFHQDGAGRIPARPFLGFTDSSLATYQQHIADQLVTQLST